ncbi:MAG: NAD(P)H-dependent oxidoreductase subunit E [Candidatus Sabulitectum sp.]|nr:NAD(P)H-dependent oxidoreductase subunit E [Candidatus Sabulitectum sp.]
MTENFEKVIREICTHNANDRTRMMDIVREVQQCFGQVSGQAMDIIADAVDSHRVEVESVISFYSFLSEKPKGKFVIRLCNDVVDKMQGVDKVAQAFREELGIDFGESTPDGKFTLEWTPCIGMCDQAPAALINDKMMTRLSSDSAREIVKSLMENGDENRLTHMLGDGNNANSLVNSMVTNNIREKGPVIFADLEAGTALHKALAMSAVEVIKDVKTARLRGRGGAGFPTGMKWEFTRAADGDNKVVICNADEGEPGTFKDRVVLTEKPDLMFEGMTIAGYAIGAKTGVVYLRGEYAYLRTFLEKVLADRRNKNLLGISILGKTGFDFDIRIQMGAGAYICGEETALISSCEGLRGDPKNRPPFPAQKGYLAQPTSVNNVETFCCVARILDKGAGWFAEIGSPGSTGTKLLSISGDCMRPGVYELDFGITVNHMLEKVGAENAYAVQVGGPSGQLIGRADFHRTICYDDVATGGAVMIFNEDRNPLEIAHEFMEFFCEESCGYCTPCRAGNELIKERLEVIMEGKGTPEDLDYLEQLGKTVAVASRCGLGQTSPNPVLTSLKNFRNEYEKLVKENKDGMQRTFDIHKALATGEELQGRKSVIYVD